MIVSDKFEIEKDLHSWNLTYNYLGKDKDGNDKTHKKTTYHANLKQVAKSIINYSAGECKSMDELILMLDKAENIVEKLLTERLEQ